VGVFSSVLSSNGFAEALGHPSPARKGLLGAIYYLGTWLSYIFLSHNVSDYVGRRYAALTGTFIVAVGNAFECGSRGPGAFAMMVVGRIISGIGVGMVSTSVPLYQRFANLQHERCFIADRHG
jgi:MFS family permease